MIGPDHAIDFIEFPAADVDELRRCKHYFAECEAVRPSA